MANKKILLGLTTTSGSDWRGKVNEIKEYNIKEVALFATGIKKETRKELYVLLENISNLRIPHVHIRDDFDNKELEYLMNKFSSILFNIHPVSSRHPNTDDYGKCMQNIYVENVETTPSEKELKRYGGLCIDFSHLEDFRLKGDNAYFEKMNNLMSDNKIGCCHVSAVGDELMIDETISDEKEYSSHTYKNLKQFDYVTRYTNLLPRYISLELENTFEEQLKAKEYLDEIINK